MFLANIIFFLSAIDTDEGFLIGVALSLCAVILHCIVWLASFFFGYHFLSETSGALCTKATIPIPN